MPEPDDGAVGFDLVSELLETSRLRATVYASPHACGAWQLNTSGDGKPGFHLVARGACWLHLRGRPVTALTAGDLVVLRRNDWHVLSARIELDGEGTSMPAGQGPVTELVCGRFDFGDALGGTLLESAPDVLVVGNDTTRLEGLARMLAAEAAGRAPGRQLALDRLSDVLFIAVLRHLMDTGAVSRGLLAALRDPRLARVLAALHARPGEAWTLVSLAGVASMSRSVFAARFVRIMGESPGQYLTRVRMDKARTLLATGERSVAAVAAQVGYASEAGFRRALARQRQRRLAGETRDH